jgi:metallo-beta-lactamase family protein
VLPDPTMVDRADYLLVESTYGNRVHEESDEGAKLEHVVKETADRGGRVIIPSFAVGRVEELLYWLKRLEDERRIPVLPVFLDSPMAIEALARYTARLHELDAEMQPETSDGKAPHGPADRSESLDRRRQHARKERQLCVFCTERFRTVASPSESKALTSSKMPAIVISSSGMATGGRVLHHLKAGLPDSRNTVLFVGYQAAGTRGRSLVDGATSVKIHGEVVPVHAHVAQIESMSAHADSTEIMRWLGGFSEAPRTTFIVHGELPAMEALQGSIQARPGWTTKIPEHRESVTLVP